MVSDASSLGRSQIDVLLKRIVSLHRKSFSGILRGLPGKLVRRQLSTLIGWIISSYIQSLLFFWVCTRILGGCGKDECLF